MADPQCHSTLPDKGVKLNSCCKKLVGRLLLAYYGATVLLALVRNHCELPETKHGTPRPQSNDETWKNTSPHQVRSDEGPQYNSLLLGGPGLSPGQVGDVQPPPESKEVSKVYPLVNLTARAMEDMANLQMIDIQ